MFENESEMPDCRECGHPVGAHDPGECWTDGDNVEHPPEGPCLCWGYQLA